MNFQSWAKIPSPNAEEAFSLLSMPLPVTKRGIEEACERFLNFGVGESSEGCVIIRSGALGAHVANRDNGGRWIDAYWAENDLERVVDVTGIFIAARTQAISDFI
jgi:hypothetical protein